MPETVNLFDPDATPHAELFERGPRTVRLKLAAGEAMPAHDHPELDVLIHVVDGEMAVRLDDETYDLSAGDLLRFAGEREIVPEAITDCVALVVLAPREE